MVDRAFLRPRSVIEPPQGDYQYFPIVRFYEDTTRAGLQAQMNVTFSVDAQSLSEFWVIEQVEFDVEVTKPAVGGNPAELIWTAMVWATQAIKV